MDLYIFFLGIFFLFFFIIFNLLLSSSSSLKTKDFLGAIIVTITLVVSYLISEVILSMISGGLHAINSRLAFTASVPAAIIATWISLIVSFYYWEGIQRKNSLINIVFLSSIFAFIVADIFSSVVQFLF